MTDPRNERTDAGVGDDVPSEHQNRTEPQAPAPDEMSDEEAQRIAAEQTASTSKNADKAGKDWEGNPQNAPETL
jgi:hypothetical protein